MRTGRCQHRHGPLGPRLAVGIADERLRAAHAATGPRREDEAAIVICRCQVVDVHGEVVSGQRIDEEVCIHDGVVGPVREAMSGSGPIVRGLTSRGLVTSR